MARDAVAITDLASAAGTTTPAGTTIVPANGAVINGAGDTGRLVVRVTNTHTSAHPVTFRAGVNPPAVREGLGDLVVTVPLTSGDLLFVLESARFAQADGSIQVDFETGMTGKISALRLPKAA